MTQQLIEIKKLDHSPLNVRKTDSGAALDELKASILAHGLMQNLVVVPAKKGKYHVIAGGRRLEALKALQEEGKLPADHSIPCQIAEQERAVELSLAENTVRHAMHPADEFEAFAALIEQKHTASQIALRFGCTEKHVLQRLKLGRVAPALMTAYRAEELSLDALMAFTITDDRKRQISVYKSLQGWQKNNARHIREALTAKMVKSDDKLAAFVGLEAYQAADGKIRPDLFSEVTYLEDAVLLEKMAAEKLQAAADALKAEGWGWVEASPDKDYGFTSRFGRIRPRPIGAPADLLALKEQIEVERQKIENAIDAIEDEDELESLYEKDHALEARYYELAERLDSFAAYGPEEMKHAGCYITISHDGSLSIEKGLVKPEDRRKTADESKGETEAKEKPVHSQSLTDDLTSYRLQAAQVELARNPEIAFDLLVFTLARSHLGHMPIYSGYDIHLTPHSGTHTVRKERTTASEAFDEVKRLLPLDWLSADDDERSQFAAFSKLGHSQKLAILACCTAQGLRPQLGGGDDAFEEALTLTGGEIAAYWRPTKENYLSRVSKDRLLAIGQEIYGGQWAERWKGRKKGEMVDRLNRAFSNPDTNGGNHETVTPDTIKKLKTWLPFGMAFKAPEEKNA